MAGLLVPVGPALPADRPDFLDIRSCAPGEHPGMHSSPHSVALRRQQWRSMGLVLAASVLWGTTGTAQIFAPGGLSPLWVGAGRLAVAAAFFALLHASVSRTCAVGTAGLRPHWPMLVLAGLTMAIYNLAFFAGVRASSVAIGTALAIGSGPVWAGLLQWMLGGGAPAGIWWLGTALAVGGGSLMVLSTAGTVVYTPMGVALCLLAGLSYAAYTLANKRLAAQVAPSLANAWVFGLAMCLGIPAAAWLAPMPVLVAGDVWVLLYLGIVATGISYALFTRGLRHIAGPTGVALALGEPVTAFLLAVLVVGESPGAGAVAGMLLVLVGLAVVMRAELRTAPAA